MVYKRHLNKTLDRFLKALAMINFVILVMINDFDGIRGFLQILGMVAIEIILVTILNIWGRND